MTTTVTCPICEQKVLDSKINEHLDRNCGSTNTTTHKGTFINNTSKGTLTRDDTRTPAKNTKLAPIFSLGKRGPETRPAFLQDDVETLVACSSSQTQPIDIDEEPSPPPKRARRTGGEPGANKRGLIQMTSTFAPTRPSVQAPPGGYLRAAAPLAERLRPQDLEDFVGQEHLTGSDGLLSSLIESGNIGSMVLWGPPGCGKTTLARLIATRMDIIFKELSATSSGINDVKGIFEEAKNILRLTGRKTCLFMDEIQRFNKGQQDVFLPYVESGVVSLVGATTENPSFKLNSALLSRCRVFVLEKLSDDHIKEILEKAITRVTGVPKGSIQEASADDTETGHTTIQLGRDTPSEHEAEGSGPSKQVQPQYRQVTGPILKAITNLSLGDARTALSLLELVLSSPAKAPESALIASLRRSVSGRYDRSGEDRYDMISALHKSLRGSDGGAALYWLARMLTSGEDPQYVARRLIVVASEDVGLADNHALPLAIATMAAVQHIGMPECRINLAHCVTYLAEAPKSTRSYEAYKRAEAAAKEDPTLPVPLHLRNAPTSLMKDLNYGDGYLYNPAFAHPVYQEYTPPMVHGEDILLPEGAGKEWDEKLLLEWEYRGNKGGEWEGRSHHEHGSERGGEK